jgi:hypothetical protein
MDNAVRRIKKTPMTPNVKGNPLVLYRCRFCKFRTRRMTRAWAHSETHGPWEEELGGSKGYKLSLVKPKTPYRHHE